MQFSPDRFGLSPEVLTMKSRYSKLNVDMVVIATIDIKV